VALGLPDPVQPRRASDALGVVVDADAREIDDALARALRALFTTEYLLVLRAQDLADDEHLAVMEALGPIAWEGVPEKRAIGFVSNVRPDGTLGTSAASYHIDFGFFPEPYHAISLYGLEIPDRGTQTYFVNAVAAAAALPDELAKRLEGVRARQAVDIASPAGQAGVRVREGRLDERYPHTVRPVLWPHRTTGAPILGVWEQHTDALYRGDVEMDADESTALIEELYAFLYQPRFTYVHEWQEGDLVIWDNHAVQHGRPEVGHHDARTLRRVCVGPEQDLSLFAGRRVS
jgi:alpha-ketoglutarate-dependent taurine dioxygenase